MKFVATALFALFASQANAIIIPYTYTTPPQRYINEVKEFNQIDNVARAIVYFDHNGSRSWVKKTSTVQTNDELATSMLEQCNEHLFKRGLNDRNNDEKFNNDGKLKVKCERQGWPLLKDNGFKPVKQMVTDKDIAEARNKIEE